MSFTPEQIAALEAKLDARHVETRTQAGRTLSYISGWHAIAEANRIFGFDGWDRETVDLRQLGEPREVEGKMRVAYMAKVRITVKDHSDMFVTREGTGYGSGIDRDLGQAHESAIKESETDAMKRALMTFGNPFGLALYDKKQENVTSGPVSDLARVDRPKAEAAFVEPPSALKRLTSAQAKDRGLHTKIEDAINGCKTLTNLVELEQSAPFAMLRDQCPLAWLDGISNHLVVRRENILVETAEHDMDKEYAETVR